MKPPDSTPIFQLHKSKIMSYNLKVGIASTHARRKTINAIPEEDNQPSTTQPSQKKSKSFRSEIDRNEQFPHQPINQYLSPDGITTIYQKPNQAPHGKNTDSNKTLKPSKNHTESTGHARITSVYKNHTKRRRTALNRSYLKIAAHTSLNNCADKRLKKDENGEIRTLLFAL